MLSGIQMECQVNRYVFWFGMMSSWKYKFGSCLHIDDV